jgi:hypothetical protein
MAVKMHVTKIEAADEGGVLVSVIIESDLGPIELEIHADLKTAAAGYAGDWVSQRKIIGFRRVNAGGVTQGAFGQTRRLDVRHQPPSGQLPDSRSVQKSGLSAVGTAVSFS